MRSAIGSLATVFLLGDTAFALMTLLAPRLTYAIIALLFGTLAPVRPCSAPGYIDAILGLVSFCVAPYFAYLALSAEPLLREANGGERWGRRLSPAVENLQNIAMLTPLWLKPLEDAFGWLPCLAAVVLWFVSSLSVLANIAAAAACRFEQEGKQPSPMLLDCLYNLGGAVGAYAARRAWPESRTIESVTKEPPYAFGFLVTAAILSFAIRLTN
jgi:hypothetical protein